MFRIGRGGVRRFRWFPDDGLRVPSLHQAHYTKLTPRPRPGKQRPYRPNLKRPSDTWPRSQVLVIRKGNTGPEPGTPVLTAGQAERPITCLQGMTTHFHIDARWPSPDILPETVEAFSATAAIGICTTFLQKGCQIDAVRLTDESGEVCSLRVRDLLKLAREEGYRGRFPPRNRRKPQRTLASILLAMLASALPNSFGDFATVVEFSMGRVAIRRTVGRARSRKTSHMNLEVRGVRCTNIPTSIEIMQTSSAHAETPVERTPHRL